MPKLNQYHPQSVTHPGVTLAEKLEEIKMGPKELSIKTGRPEKTISAILRQKSAITPDMAVQLENVLLIPAHFWLQRQSQHDESLARKKSLQSVVLKAADWVNSFPVKQMLDLGWISDFGNVEEKTLALFHFFGVANHRAWEKYYLRSDLKVRFRISLAQTNAPFAISAWLRRGELLAEEMETPPYSRVGLERALPSIKKIMATHPDNFFQQLQDSCLKVGVKVVPTPCLPKAPICGATRWLGNNPIVQLSGRYKRNDSFWFTFFHEIGHILLHGKKEIFLEQVEYDEKDMVKEREADKFAANWLLSQDEEDEILALTQLLEEDVIAFAKKFNTHPAIIIGRLQHKKIIPYHVGQRFIEPISLEGK